jgi:alpha-N-arabinofuranosidase
VKGPRSLARGSRATGDELTGNFTRRDEFDRTEALQPEWIFAYPPSRKWWDLGPGELSIQPLKVPLDARRNSSFLARRQQHLHFDASTQLEPPAQGGIAAGLAAYQNARHWYFLGTRRVGDEIQLFLERRADQRFQIVTGLAIPAPEHLRLRISGDGGKYSFYYDAGKGWQPLRENDDGSILSTEIAGGFVGTVLGPYARQE